MTSEMSYSSRLLNIEARKNKRILFISQMKVALNTVYLWTSLFSLPVGLRHMMTGVPGPWLSIPIAGLKAEEDAVEGWLA